jgi:hypothetical protein
MSARKKLNGMYLIACVVLAAFLGLAFQSWWAFAAAFVLAAGSQMISGNIRLAPEQRY